MTKVGLFGIGLDTYWDQLDGLRDNLKGYQRQIKNKIENFGVELVDAGMVDDPVKAREAADLLKSGDVEIVFLYVSTYALSSTVLPVAQKLKVPVVVLNLQPVPQLDYEEWNEIKEWTEAAQMAASMKNNRLGILGHYYNGMLDVYTDITKQSAIFGSHIELLEM